MPERRRRQPSTADVAMDDLVRRYFSTSVLLHGDTPAGVGWAASSQRRRFEQLLLVGDLQHARVLDIGCGFADFYDCLRERGFQGTYTGYDVTPAVLDVARRKHPELAARLALCNVLTEDVDERFDYVFANGVLNLRGSGNTRHMVRLLRRMYELADEGVAATMTSNLAHQQVPGIFYFDPGAISRAVARFCGNFRLDHSYLQHDFAVFCYRRELSATG